MSNPPDGVTTVTEGLISLLTMRGVDFERSDVHGSCNRLRSMVTHLRFLVRHRRMNARTYYRTVAGGAGAIEDLIAILCARLCRMPIILHHHTYRYILERSRIHALLFKAASPRSSHIALDNHMRDRLCAVYRIGSAQVDVVSNIGLLQLQRPPIFRRVTARGPIRIGMLGNLTVDKGAEYSIQLCEVLRTEGLDIRLELAGPIADGRITELVQARQGANWLSCIGPVSGSRKANFLASLDILLMPSRLPEAQPCVIYEALYVGTPVVAMGSGGIPHQLASFPLPVLAPGSSVSEAASVVRAVLASPPTRALLTSICALEREAAQRSLAKALDRSSLHDTTT